MADKAALDQRSIVPSIRAACTTVQITITTASETCADRQNRGRTLRRVAARNAVVKIAHIAITPQAENGVGERNNSASMTSGGLVSQSPTT